jgi:radical SAM protein with 4Fe4S-binding SPASM domain
MNKRRFKKAVKRILRLPKNKYLFLYLANKARHFYLKLVKSTRVAYPSTIMIELTNHCNLACTTCPREYAYGKEMDQGKIGVDQARKIIDELWPYLDSIGLTGMGETFLYKEIGEIVDYIKSKNKGIIISVSTNANLPGFMDRVAPLIGKIDTIQISIDGLDKVYENIRRKASFKSLDENLRWLAEKSRGTATTLMLNMVVTKENFHHMSLLVGYAEEVGIDYLDFTLFNLAAVTDIEASYYEFYKSPEFLGAVLALENTIRGTKRVSVTNKNFETENGFQKCPFPWTHFYICWDGFVPPCCAKPFPKELNFGNVFEKKVMDVLNSDTYRQFRKQWFANEAPDFCDKCHFLEITPISAG